MFLNEQLEKLSQENPTLFSAEYAARRVAESPLSKLRKKEIQDVSKDGSEKESMQA